MKALSGPVKIGLKLLLGVVVVAVVATQVTLADELGLESGSVRRVVVGRDLEIQGEVLLDPKFDAAGVIVGAGFSAPVEESQVIRRADRYEVTRKGSRGHAETSTGSSLAWRGTASITLEGESSPRTFPLAGDGERVSVREDGKDPVRVSLSAKHGLRGIASRLFKQPVLIFGAMAFLLWAYATSSYRWALLLRSQQLPASFGRCFRLTFIGFFFNNVLPGLTGGDLVKAVMIAQDHPEYRARAVGTVIVDRILGLLVLALISGAVLVFKLDQYREASIAIFGFLAAATAATVLFLSRRVRRFLRLDVLAARLPAAGVLKKLDQAFFLYRSQPKTIAVAAGLSFLAHIGNIGAVFCLGLGVGLDESAGITGSPLAAYVATVPVAMIVSSIPLLPGGWGVGEAAFAYFFRAVGVWNLDLSIALSVVQRTAALLWSLVGGALFFTHRRRTMDALHAAEAAGEPGDPPREN